MHSTCIEGVSPFTETPPPFIPVLFRVYFQADTAAVAQHYNRQHIELDSDSIPNAPFTKIVAKYLPGIVRKSPVSSKCFPGKLILVFSRSWEKK